jgi:type IV pilus assembly protein PilB
MFSKEQQTKILEKLKQEQAIEESEYQEYLQKVEQGGDVIAEIEETKIVDGEKLAQAIAAFFDWEYKDLVSVKVDIKILKIIPEDIAINYKVVVFEKDGEMIHVAMKDPTDLKAQEVVEYIARENNLKIKYFVTSANSLEEILKQYSGLKLEVGEALDVAEGKMKEKKEKQDKKIKKEDLEEVVKSAPVAKMISVILKHAVDGRASDIHIEPFSNGSRVRYRIDGVMKTYLKLPKYIHSALVSRVKVLANLKIDETRIPQDGRIRLNILGKDVDFRVSTLPLYEQEKVVMRILDTSSGTLSLEDLGFEGRNLRVIQENINKPNGMFLVTGPTGSGKSTTLYSVLNILNKEEVNIITLEDPVEYYIGGINQSQIRPEVGLTFATGLRSILRQDPDIIMVGEIRDNETAELGVHASLTGHFVLSTLHTNDALGAIPRLSEMSVEPYLISSTLNVVLAQRLVRKICNDCKEEDKQIPDAFKKQAQEQLEKVADESKPEELRNIKEFKFYKGKGCARCNKTGFKGRVSISEVVDMTEQMKELIAGKKLGGKEMEEEFIRQGGVSIQQDGIMKALRGITTMDEVIRVTKDD